MIKTQKTKIAVLLLVLVTLFTALFIPINAAVIEISEDIDIEEIMPMAASTNCSISLPEDAAIQYAINFLGPNSYVDPTTYYSRSDSSDGFKQVRFDLDENPPHINCEIFRRNSKGGYDYVYNMHVYIID